MKNKKYYLGLDPGTASIGYAVTDLNYNLVRKGQKYLWGTRLFLSGKTAKDRRVNRASKITLMRKKYRISLLQDIFSNEILSIDNGFFIRIKESMYHSEDKSVIQLNGLFNDKSFDDKDYFKKYKTIYHLKKDIIDGNVHDPRLLYLAISHSLKHRGHFLFEDQSFSNDGNFNELFKSLNEYLEEEGITTSFYLNVENVESILKNTKLGINSKSKEIQGISTTKFDEKQKSIIQLLVGGKIKLSKIFDEVEKEDDISISFKEKFDESYPKIELLLEDKTALIDIIKSIYDWMILSDILKNKKYLCEAKVETYQQHHNDIKLLKEFIKKYLNSEYLNVFATNKKELHNYVSYVYLNKKNNKKEAILNKCTQEEFCKYLNSLISKVSSYDEKYDQMINSIELNTFAPKQLTNNNCVIPYQVNLLELTAMLDGAKNNIKFLNDVTNGVSNVDKIISLLTFRVPYYVGHLNNTHKNSWIIKRSNEKITPWNFNKVVDIESCAKEFIYRMTNKCTYLIENDVIPKESLLYSKFMVLNEINSIKVDGESISVELKKAIYHELFEKFSKITMTTLTNFIKNYLSTTNKITITGIDKDIKSSLKSHLILNELVPNLNDDMKEEIIKQIVLFSGDKKLLSSTLSKIANFDKDTLRKLTNLKFKDWSRLSKEFLLNITDYNKDTGEELNIISMMYETNNNLMQLLSNSYNYINKVKDSNSIDSKITLESVQNLYCSPAVKKTIWQCYKIVEEITKVMGCKPEKIFIETTREESEKVRTTSRKTSLLSVYSSIKKDEPILFDSLNDREEKDLRSKKLFLYYTQLGKCAYTNEPIDIENLFNNNLYDIEHIYPRSKTMDDSIINNLILVKKTANKDKEDNFKIPDQYKQYDLWNKLYDLKLISPEKHKRLVRNDEFTSEELEGFINRQLVETSQASKAIIELMSNYLSDTNGKVVYCKAKNVSEFRHHFDIIKVRELNDLHHAHDAYLNIIVGNVYDTKFTKNFFKNISYEKYSLKPEVLFSSKFNGVDCWSDDTISIVKNNISNKRVLFTRQSYQGAGQLFNLNPVKKNTGKNIGIPLKLNDKLKDVTKYGSYIGSNPSYYTLVEYKKGKKNIRTLICIPVPIAKLAENNPDVIKNYIINKINSNNFKVIMKRIKLDSLIKADGMIVHISGGKDVKNAVQLTIEYNQAVYLKYILKTLNSKSNIDTDKNITVNQNILLFKTLKDKLNTNIYSKLSTLKLVYDVLNNNQLTFENLTKEGQIIIIKEIMKLFSCTASRAKLNLINGPSEAGRQDIKLNISKYSQFILINQSITGIYEQEIDLLTIEATNEF